MMASKNNHPGVVADNRKARHDYDIEETIEAGIVLSGSEIKSVRAGRVNLRGSFARVVNDEVFLYDAHIAPYEQSGKYFNHDPLRPRKLLLHRREINRLNGLVRMKGMTLVPLKIYFKGRRAKVELGVARGKKIYDKREDIARRDAARDIDRALKRSRQER
ncbi:SsrA-binding protein SmpB [uncultured Chloroflexus sp.]|uniref:SsrA-binding protein SmpB n=1 Tax=uncultured Chloroflexus sp. TaxID=214040 RepID=UPI002626E6EF|nr:SsrA-binding protein SmpB [uncultured Chloroflexus sp.]